MINCRAVNRVGLAKMKQFIERFTQDNGLAIKAITHGLIAKRKTKDISRNHVLK